MLQMSNMLRGERENKSLTLFLSDSLRYQIEQNWEMGKHTMTMLKGHTASISCVSLDVNSINNTLVSGSVDTKINIWDLRTQKVLKTLRGKCERERWKSEE